MFDRHIEILDPKLEGQSMEWLRRGFNKLSRTSIPSGFRFPKMLLIQRYPAYLIPTLPLVFQTLESQYHPIMIKAYCPARNPDTRSLMRILPIGVWKT